MAFNQRIAFEVDSATGNNNNGGGFDDTSGVPGTNYAWGAGQTTIAYTDIVVGVTTTNVSSVTRPFIAADVGNVFKGITQTGSATLGRFQILSVTAGVAALDRSAGTSAGVFTSAVLGGSLLTIQEGINAAFINAGAIADCRVYVKKATYAATIALITAGSVSASGYRQRIIGYNITHGDDPTPQSGNQPIYAVGSGAGVKGISITTSGFSIENITIDGTASGGTQGTQGITTASGNFLTIYNVKIKNFSGEALLANAPPTGGGSLSYSEITGCGGTNGVIVPGAAGFNILYNWIHKNTKTAIYNPGALSIAIVGNLITNNSGASTDGILFSYGDFIAENTIYGNGRDGIRGTGNIYDTSIGIVITNNIIAKNGGFGINSPTSPAAPLANSRLNYNAYYSNTSGNYGNLAAGNNDVQISTNPFNSSDANLASETSPDWGLNNTSGAGLSLRALAGPANPPGLINTTSYRDIGFPQHQDSGGGGIVGTSLSRVFTGL